MRDGCGTDGRTDGVKSIYPPTTSYNETLVNSTLEIKASIWHKLSLNCSHVNQSSFGMGYLGHNQWILQTIYFFTFSNETFQNTMPNGHKTLFFSINSPPDLSLLHSDNYRFLRRLYHHESMGLNQFHILSPPIVSKYKPLMNESLSINNSDDLTNNCPTHISKIGDNALLYRHTPRQAIHGSLNSLRPSDAYLHQ